MNDQQPVLTETIDGVRLITLNRPESLNALSSGLVEGLVTAMNQAVADSDIRVIVLTGRGESLLCRCRLERIE